MRADDRALAAVDAYVRIPYRHLERDGSLLVASRPGRKASIAGRADTGNRSPLPSMSIEVTCLTKSGPIRDRDADRSARGSPSGISTWTRLASAASMGQSCGPRWCDPACRSLGDRGLDLGHRLVAGSIPERAKKHGCITVLIRLRAGPPQRPCWRRPPRTECACPAAGVAPCPGSRPTPQGTVKAVEKEDRAVSCHIECRRGSSSPN